MTSSNVSIKKASTWRCSCSQTSLTNLYDIVGDWLWVTRIPSERDARCSSLCHHRDARGFRQRYKKYENKKVRKTPI